MLQNKSFDIMDATRAMPAANVQVSRTWSSSGSSSDCSVSDERLQRQQNEQLAVAVVDTFGSWLDDVDDLVTHLETDGEHLGSAVLRKCQEIADGIGAMAQRLEEQSAEDRQTLASACVGDLQTALAAPSTVNTPSVTDLQLQDESLGSAPSGDGAVAGVPTGSATSAMVPLYYNEDVQRQRDELLGLRTQDMDRILQAATALLRDVEDAFRSIDKRDADEIADVAVTLARLFLVSLQSVQFQLEGLVYRQITTNDDQRTVPLSPVHSGRSGPQIEILEERLHTSSSSGRTKTSRRSKQPQRMRILWPPLGPRVAAALEWGKETATAKPLLTAAIGLTLWPVAFGTAVVGGGVVVADSILQNLYNHMQNTQEPIMRQLECGAAQAWQTARLSLLTGRLVAKQGVRVVQHQVDRQGGWPQVGQNVAGMAVDRLCHPIETVGMAWNATAWSVGAVSDIVGQVVHQSRRNEEEELAAQQFH